MFGRCNGKKEQLSAEVTGRGMALTAHRDMLTAASCATSSGAG